MSISPAPSTAARNAASATASGLADEGIDRAVRVGARIHVEKPHAGHARYRAGDRVYDGLVASLREIRDALDQPAHQGAPASRKSTTSAVMARIAIGTDSSAA